MKKLFLLFTLFIYVAAFSQEKKRLEHSDFDNWNKINSTLISDNGKWISYELKPGYGDPTLFLINAKGKEIIRYHRGNDAQFCYNNNYIAFKIKAQLDSINKQRRNKVKEDDLLKDSLAIYNLKTNKLIKFPLIKSFKLPEKWGTYLAYQIYPESMPKEQKSDTIKADNKPKKGKKDKKENEKNGYSLVVRNLENEIQDTFPFVKDYLFAEKAQKLLFYSTGKDSGFQQGVYLLDLKQGKLNPLCRGKAEYKNLTINDNGTLAVFIADRDTTKERIRPYELFLWKEQQDSAFIIANNQSAFLTENRIINENAKLYFSGNSSRLFFGTSPKPFLQDTMLLPEEIVNVEVWNYKDQRLYTQQNAEIKNDLKKSYLCMYQIKEALFSQIEHEDMAEFEMGYKANAEWAVAISNKEYQKYLSWENSPDHYDIYKINLGSNNKEIVVKDVRSWSVKISPAGNYIYWFGAIDSSWYIHHNKTGKTMKLMDSRDALLCDELNDMPNFPYPYGIAGWTSKDNYLLIYDRYDIWLVDPEGIESPRKITNGRAEKTQYRYINLSKEDPFIDMEKEQIIRSVNEITRQEAYHKLNLQKLTSIRLYNGNLMLRGLIKAENEEKFVFTKETFTVFPNLLYTDFEFKKILQISDANPQQKDFNWGTAELYKWKSLDGKELEGLLYKPENFDPAKKYPIIVNFYEKSSEDLYRHIAPEPHRSTINYSFYTSRGYIVFNPDIVYRTGYPGESCYNSVMPGITSLLEQGFIDKEKIGVQGHSWGAYQIVYLLTKTGIFAAAEAGAPVPDMISAYGGIRWQTGLSRMFQYEHSQSRIGGTLWEYPMRYIENSPIFFLDKVNTPLLIMHNDNDGHVPWYQGIELFVAMRRLGKAAWMLNYNGEPHWPLKWQNRKDFNIRLQQFFDHYLKGEAMPEWMDKGIPATEKGINNAYELINK